MKEKLDEYLTIKSKNKYTILFNILEVLGLVSYISAVILFDNIWYRGLFVLIGLILISIYAFQKGIISKILSNKFFTKVSKYEMEFFLWHQVIINFLMLIGFNSWNLLIASFILTCIVSFLYQYLYNVLKNRIKEFGHKNNLKREDSGV